MMSSAIFSPGQLQAQLGVPITRLVSDSRAIQAGDTFVAYPGGATDGRKFISQAMARGANAVIWETGQFVWNDDWMLPNLGVSDLRRHAGELADAVYGSPSAALWMVGVTGTNGKTSTTHWVARALSDAQRPCALIGTLGNGFPGTLQQSANTTPDVITVHTLLADYVREGAQAVAMEVSSHALAQGRVDAVRFDVALFTNLSRDHLDYHGDMQSYADSKRLLFERGGLKFVVLNLDDAYGGNLARQLASDSVEVVAYGLSEMAMQQAEQLGVRRVHGKLMRMSGKGLSLAIASSWGATEIDSTLVGHFNAENLLGALAVLLISGVPITDAAASLSKVQAVAGRMQQVGSAQQPTVIVDYAHTPDALEKVLRTLREVSALQNGKLICVFGCGGDRDRGKRAVMGAVAEELSDHCVVTSDNPRSEEPQQIIAEIVGGMREGRHEIIVNRAEAIKRAIGLAQQRDTVLVAGKGHEEYQEIQGVRHAFSDVLVAQQALQTWQQEGRA
jgi:UDP-N-acetylmuramoyl-L-alanyl-D-glutamate--2,6-diaminopimelate ligase